MQVHIKAELYFLGVHDCNFYRDLADGTNAVLFDLPLSFHKMFQVTEKLWFAFYPVLSYSVLPHHCFFLFGAK